MSNCTYPPCKGFGNWNIKLELIKYLQKKVELHWQKYDVQ